MSDHDYQILRKLEESPKISQREIAADLGLSLGKANFLIKALMEKGWIKANNFKNSNNKIGYAYLLTPRGMKQKARLARLFLDRKINEYEALRQEINRLKEEVEGS